MTRRPRLNASNVALAPHLLRAKARLLGDEVKCLTRVGPRSGRSLFSLDLHVGVTPDLAHGLRALDCHVQSWSISSHNHLRQNPGRVPDPVAIVNSWTWRDLDEARIVRFQRRYGRFLRTFDGFVVTHVPAFAQLFQPFDRPMLIVISTRYEDPYTASPSAWQKLNSELRELLSSGRALIMANNSADADYFQHFVGVQVPVIPSLCMEPSRVWRGIQDGQKFFFSGRMSSPALMEDCRSSGVPVLEQPFNWHDVLGAAEIFVIPQNVSTMLLFELATAGVPVAVPSPGWLKNLWSQGLALQELTFTQLRSLDPTSVANDRLLDWESPSFADWWIERADFYNQPLMPNVRFVDSWADFRDGITTAQQYRSAYTDLIRVRNEELVSRRQLQLSKFSTMLGGS